MKKQLCVGFGSYFLQRIHVLSTFAPISREDAKLKNSFRETLLLKFI